MFKGMETGKGKYFYKALPEFLLEEQFEDKKKAKLLMISMNWLKEFLIILKMNMAMTSN